MKALLLILSVSLLLACGDDFSPASRLTGLRLIAVRADKPAARAGEEVTLTAIHHDREGRALSWGYALCDGSASSAALDCMRAMQRGSLVVARDQTEFRFTMPEQSGNGQRATSLGVVVIVCPGEILAGDTHGVPVACAVDGAPLDVNEFEMGVKRIFYAGAAPQHNPQIAEVRWDGEPWPEGELKRVEACDRDTDDVSDCAAHLLHTIELEAPNAAELFQDTRGNEVREQVVAQYYGTGGTFEWDVRTLSEARTRWVARRSDAGQTLTLYFVVRDSRGGVSWEIRSVEVGE